VNSTFQNKLKSLTFTTFYRNQKEIFGYDDLFSSRRVLVFSVTQFRTLCSITQINGFMDNYQNFINCGIDGIYVVDSNDWLISPYIDKKAPDLIGLPDRDYLFVQALAEHYEYKKTALSLARFWQYVVIINNGEPEKIWHNPFKEDAPLGLLKEPKHRYRKISPVEILKNLVDIKN